MILFHGTNGEKTIEKILSEGLVAFRLPHWATDLAPRFLDGVFLSTSPVAGKGGDPVSFAMGWPVKRWRGKGAGYIVVVDLPKQEQPRIKAAIPNLKVEQYIDSQKIRSDGTTTVGHARCPIGISSTGSPVTYEIAGFRSIRCLIT